LIYLKLNIKTVKIMDSPMTIKYVENLVGRYVIILTDFIY